MACDNGVQVGEAQSKRVMAPLWVSDTEAEEKRVKGVAARKVARAKSASGGSRADAVGGSREGRKGEEGSCETALTRQHR